MGLDVYFHKLKKNENVENVTDWSVISEECDRQSTEALTKAYDDCILSLKRARNYNSAYNRVMKILCKFTNYPHFDYKALGVSYDYKSGKYSFNPASIKVFLDERDNILKSHYAPHIAYFRKANFVYAFFSNKLVNECAWVTREDLKDLIDRCEKVLNDHSLAEELLPTRAGFFFGSTEYDEWYYQDVKNCLKQMKKLLKDFADDEVMYVVMSW